MHFLHIAFFVQFPFFENIADMAGYNRLISLEKFHHLCLRQPDRLLPKVDFEQALPALGLINDYFTMFVLHATPQYPRFEKKASGMVPLAAITSTIGLVKSWDAKPHLRY